MAVSNQDEQRIALFIDFENIAIGVRDAHYRKFDVNLVLERLLDKGKVLVKKAYADWSRYSDYKRSFHEAAIELIEVPQKSVGGKNSADIRLVVDAMDMSFQKEHINCFVVASGDSDFSPLVSKLKENNKYVIGVGVKNSTSDLLIENCDEFIFYEDLVRVQQRPIAKIANVSEKLQECFSLLVDSVVALQRENKEVLWGSMVKETMKRKKPQFNETYFGFRTFSHLLEEAQRQGIVTLRRDQRSGSYVVDDLGAASRETTGGQASGAPAAQAAAPRPAEPAVAAASPSTAASANGPAAQGEAGAARGPRRRRGRGRGRGRDVSPLAAGAFPDAGGPQSAEDADVGDEADDEMDDGAEGADESPSREVEPAPSRDSLRPHLHEPSESGEERKPDEPRAAGPEAEQGRSPFSFFSSWMRREAPEEQPEDREEPGPEKPPER
ncbi:MAG: NYN domain-containing protein [Vicinamibacteria bacterium]